MQPPPLPIYTIMLMKKQGSRLKPVKCVKYDSQQVLIRNNETRDEEAF